MIFDVNIQEHGYTNPSVESITWHRHSINATGHIPCRICVRFDWHSSNRFNCSLLHANTIRITLRAMQKEKGAFNGLSDNSSQCHPRRTHLDAQILNSRCVIIMIILILCIEKLLLIICSYWLSFNFYYYLMLYSFLTCIGILQTGSFGPIRSVHAVFMWFSSQVISNRSSIISPVLKQIFDCSCWLYFCQSFLSTGCANFVFFCLFFATIQIIS